MKKFVFYSAVAMAMMATSCSNEAPVVESDGVSTITVTLPGSLSTRAFGDGKSTDVVKYAIYDGETGDFLYSSQAGFDENDPTKATVELSLANGKSYKIAFYATFGEGGYDCNWDTKIITVDYTKLSSQDYARDENGSLATDENGDLIVTYTPNYNEVDYDAFFAMYETEVITGPISDNVTLKRFLAQVTWGASDLENSTVTAIYGENASNLKTKVEYTNVYTQYDFWNGEVTGDPTTAVFDYASRPTADYPFDRWTYSYVSVNYLLVPADKTLVTATLTPNDGTKDYKVTTVTNLPVQANYKTRIEGDLFTSQAVITVAEETQFDGEYRENLNSDED